PLNADELVSIYHAYRETRPRNASAYTTALRARSALIPIDNTLAALAAVFITDPAPEGHSVENEADRYTELQRTVASAYNVKPS
ncbi:hypothetical protein NL533_34040, partial [Klebsiella pneumoniae]|nr:hypothetical protein [Klebsiella pneumoniae]